MRVAHFGLIVCAAGSLWTSGTARAQDSGPATAEKLTRLYNDTRDNCGDSTKPAFLCSGVLLRPTTASPKRRFYSAPAASQQSGEISFSYLRKDVPFSTGGGNTFHSGFILSPAAEIPQDDKRYDVKRFFPVSSTASSFSSPTDPSCQATGVESAEKWSEQYQKTGGIYSSKLCAFDVSKRERDAAGVFHQGILAKTKAGEAAEHHPNDLRVSAWPADGTPPPVAAVFYVDNKGLEEARAYQNQWHEKTQEIVPIVHLQLPKNTDESATFTYNADQQAIKSEAMAEERPSLNSDSSLQAPEKTTQQE